MATTGSSTATGDARASNGSATLQGRLWGARARDWAEIEDENSRGLFLTVLDATGVGKGTRMLDVGCGSGLACQLAAARGADVSGIDAAPALLEIAKERVPRGDFRVADMQFLPFEDDRFDVVTLFNCIFLAADQDATLKEAGRVARPGAPVVIVAFSQPERVALSAYLAALEALLPASPPGTEPLDPFIPPGELEARARRAGLQPLRTFEADWSWTYADLEQLKRGLLSAGPSSLAIEVTNEAAVEDALVNAVEPLRTASGSYRFDNVVNCMIAAA